MGCPCANFYFNDTAIRSLLAAPINNVETAPDPRAAATEPGPLPGQPISSRTVGKKVAGDYLGDAGKIAKKQPPKITEQFLGDGKPLRKTALRPADSRVRPEFKPTAKENGTVSEPDWNKRRSAMERRADGTLQAQTAQGSVALLSVYHSIWLADYVS